MSKATSRRSRAIADSDELIDLVDDRDRVIGSVAKLRANADPALAHREVAVLISRGRELLFQQRSFAKSVMPGVWDISCAGHLGAGEGPEHGARRELREELGLIAELSFAGRTLVRATNETYFAHVYCAAAPGGWRPTIDRAELRAVAWADRARLQRWRAGGRCLSAVACRLAEQFWAAGPQGCWLGDEFDD
jgi:isopentenyldiphosphate isomerase